MIYLYGAPGSGKTTLGRRLAKSLGVEFFDLDELIAGESGRSIPEIFAEEGEAAFRAAESRSLRSLASSNASASGVVALGGGTLLDSGNRDWCEASGSVICLDTPPPEELAKRLSMAPSSRPLGNRAEERAAHYASFARRISASYDLGDSLVIIGSGIAADLLRGQRCIADENVARLHRAKLPEIIAEVSSGEVNKTPDTVMHLYRALSASGFGRQDVVAAVGGGVTGDLVGFAAATFMRGIDWINVPTTLLSMVDASTGGKTGCDLPEGKNLIGAFHSPRLVIIDTDFLATLPPEVLRDGRAEMIKHEIIGGRTGFDLAANLGIKVAIVREDPFETNGRRLLLNCGHTVAHAVETLSGYSISHGQAVAIGCVAEARLAVKLGFAAQDWPTELAAAFAKEGLLVDLPEGMLWRTLVPVMRGDKKRSGSSVTFALPCGWGDVRAVPLDLSSI